MEIINRRNIILEQDVFIRSGIEKRMEDGGFNSLSKFELFIWDLEMFLQFQKKLGDKIILKGGAATQFYVPVSFQRTSIDIDMICLASRKEVHEVISEIEKEFGGVGDYCKLKLYTPKNPKLGLDVLETYFMTVPSICNEQELFSTKGKQAVKIEFLFSEDKYAINKMSQPDLFALDTQREFNILAFENLFADKLTTIGPNTIGIPAERSDEQVKQIYDVVTLFLHNVDRVLLSRQIIRSNYEKVARTECVIHKIAYDSQILFDDMKTWINKLKNIENDPDLMQRANDFQSLYLRKSVRRDKAGWAIVGYQLEMLIDTIFFDDTRILQFIQIEEMIGRLGFEHIHGPERSKLNREARSALEDRFGNTAGLSQNLFKKRADRIIWELISFINLQEIEKVLGELG